MQLYFGVVPAPCISDEDTYFTHNGVCYYYKITEDADSLYLEDTCGRTVPIDKESVRDAAFSLLLVLSASDAYNAVDLSVSQLIKEYEVNGL